MRRRGFYVPIDRGRIVDVQTLAAALLEHRGDLRSLAKLLGTPTQKATVETYGRPITPHFLSYTADDVEVTWECYELLAGRYAVLNLPSPIDQIYSAASIGKATLDALGVRPWRDKQTDVPLELIGTIMASYYGARSEVAIRRQIREVVYADFLSMYPTVCALMRTWRFVIASGITWAGSTADTQAFLGHVTIDDLQRPSTWQRLATLVQLDPDDDLLPVRAKYDETSWTIGLNYLTGGGQRFWYTLADVINAVIVGGRVPRIVQAITFRPKRRQRGLRPFALLGNPAYHVDPARDDVFKRLVEIRADIKRDRAAAGRAGDHALEDRLNAEQQALKITANAVSYGIYVELNVSPSGDRMPVTCYGPDGAFEPIDSPSQLEEPGRFFHPLLATLTAAGARLMLGIAERLARDTGLDVVFCDTDSWTFARPDGMDREEFRRRVASLQAWFQRLSPYKDADWILKTEDANFGLGTDGSINEWLVPLYCFAISDKRYALFNLDEYGRPVLRKASAHGLGHLKPPYDEHLAPLSIPAPASPLKEIGVTRWQYDLWYRMVISALAGRPDQVDLGDLPGFDAPAASQYSATTPTLLHWFDQYNDGRPYAQQVRPFGFLLAFQSRMGERPSLLQVDPTHRSRGRSRRPDAALPAVVAPYDRNPVTAANAAFDRSTGAPVPRSRLATYRQVLAQYHLHPEAKFDNGDYLDAGPTVRRRVRPRGPIQAIGKEANRWEEQFYLGINPEAQIIYGTAAADLSKYQADIASRAGGFSVREISREARVSIGTISTIRRGRGNPVEKTLRAIDRAVLTLSAVVNPEGIVKDRPSAGEPSRSPLPGG
jgi:hypothetical protein